VEELHDRGDEGFAQVYTRYADNLDGWVAGLVAAANGDAAADADDSAPRLAHRLKGSSASLGAGELAALCLRIEAIDGLPAAERDDLLQALRLEAGPVSTAVRLLLEVLRPTPEHRRSPAGPRGGCAEEVRLASVLTQ
jgi:HPt (histidine-containing phosphotransfer) domain-containing protein